MLFGAWAEAQVREGEGLEAPGTPEQPSVEQVAAKKQPISVHFNVRVDWENHLTDMDDSMAYKSAF